MGRIGTQTFSAYFEDLTDHQADELATRLFEQLVEGRIPDAVDLPTGLGKTSVMAIWLIARALAGEAERSALPRRLVYVVDRRAVVDQATDVAAKLRKHLDERLGHLKAALGLTDRSLPISTLRGQFVDNRDWLEDPAATAIVVATVDMIGSRLLFEGYGVSPKMRPFHAGLLGADALVVLDEAHLVPPFEHLMRSIAKGAAGFGPVGPDAGLVPPFRLMSLSATSAIQSDTARKASVFRLEQDDLADGTTARRLASRKTVAAIPVPNGKALSDFLAEQAWALSEAGALPIRCIVYCDSRDVAEKVERRLEDLRKVAGKKAESLADIELFVGARRVYERQFAQESLQSLGFLAGASRQHQKAAFLVATSAGEVGVDLDADHMVCDLVPWERMVQRLGRVNRRGEGDATVLVAHGEEPKPKKADKPTEQEQRQAIAFRSLEVLEALPPAVEGRAGRDASPGALRQLKQRAEADEGLRKQIADASTPEPLHPALTRPLIDAWSMTSLETHTGRPDIEPWLRGWVEQEPRTTLVWREHLPVRLGESGQAQELRKADVEAFFEAAPPHESEKLETETYRVAEWLQKRAKVLLPGKDADNAGEGKLQRSNVVAIVLSPRGDFIDAFRLDRLAEERKGRAKEDFERGLIGNTVIADCRLGGLQAGMLGLTHDDPPETADTNDAWSKQVGFRVRREEIRPEGERQADTDWEFEAEFVLRVDAEAVPVDRLVVEDFEGEAQSEDGRSAAGKSQSLVEHQHWAAIQADTIGQSLGLTASLAEALKIAARLHDEGKRAKCWQLAFRAASSSQRDRVEPPLAKTRGPINQQILAGYRHEFGSLPVLETDADFRALPEEWRDLVLHLVAAHHGSGRPVIATTGAEDAPPSMLAARAEGVARRFASMQRRWGPWGLAWLESLLRAADQQASRKLDDEASAEAKREASGG